MNNESCQEVDLLVSHLVGSTTIYHLIEPPPFSVITKNYNRFIRLSTIFIQAPILASQIGSDPVDCAHAV